jgi:hypothetical protein
VISKQLREKVFKKQNFKNIFSSIEKEKEIYNLYLEDLLEKNFSLSNEYLSKLEKETLMRWISSKMKEKNDLFYLQVLITFEYRNFHSYSLLLKMIEKHSLKFDPNQLEGIEDEDDFENKFKTIIVESLWENFLKTFKSYKNGEEASKEMFETW